MLAQEFRFTERQRQVLLPQDDYWVILRVGIQNVRLDTICLGSFLLMRSRTTIMHDAS